MSSTDKKPAQAVIMAAALFMTFIASPAAAHAILLNSVPAAGTAVRSGPLDITLHFNSRVDAGRSRVILTGAEGRLDLKVDGVGAADLSAHADELAPGTYKLHWEALSVDGHISRGDVAFSVTGDH